MHGLLNQFPDEDQKKNLMEKVKKKRLQRHQEQQLPSPLFSTLGEEACQSVSSSGTIQRTGMDSEMNSIDSVRSVSTVEHMGLREDAFTVCDVDAGLRGISIHVTDNVMGLNQECVTSSFASDRPESMRHSEKTSQLQSACLHGDSPTSVKSAASLAGTSVMEEQKKALFGSSVVLTRDQLPSDPQMYRRLTEEERVLLTCLTAAYEDTVLARLQGRQRSVMLHASNYTFRDYMTECEDQVRHVVSFVQRLADFLSLCLEDRIACFKASIGSVLTLRQCYHFVEERNTWLMEKGEMTLDLCKKLFPDIPYVDLSMEVSREVKSIAKNDVNIYAVLHCILLFDPGSENISNRQMVCNVRDKYILLLRHYLEATFSFKYSERYAKELLNKVVEIPILSAASIREAKDHSCTSSMLDSQLLNELHASD